MAFVAVDADGSEWIFEDIPERGENNWLSMPFCENFNLPSGSIARLIGRELTWDDEPVELT